MTGSPETSIAREKRVINERAVFPATIESVKAIRDGIEEDLQQFGWEEDAIQDLIIAVSDATMNSIGRGSLHIGKLEAGQMLVDEIRAWQERLPDATITVSVVLSPEEALITIDDEGDGFDFEAKLNTEFKEKDVSTNGRGVGILKKLVDVQYENGGRRIILHKTRTLTDGPTKTE